MRAAGGGRLREGPRGGGPHRPAGTRDTRGGGATPGRRLSDILDHITALFATEGGFKTSSRFFKNIFMLVLIHVD